jgi:UDP-N-acetylglucosamine--N-acetylmuramyl-(pentapeptide) pyrophosphoryl-undecaprenol N-acetylglucosamine transferase
MSGVLIMAGGTGGHVFPALAVARRLRRHQVPVAWLGTREGIEARVVPASAPDIRMEWITIRGVRGGGLRRWLALPWRLLVAMVQAFRVMRRLQPQVVLSLGGFVAGPGGLVAWLTRTPLLIHEQNAIPGMTNKWLARLADRVLTGFPGAFRTQARVQYVGNPVRAEILDVAEPAARFAARSGRLRLLVVGGSQGARALNAIVPQAVRAFSSAERPDVWHQCGRNGRESVEREYGDAPARVSEFIDDMAAAYAWADVVICRAGAMTIAELAAVGVGAILVPFPQAVDDHQTANARFLVERGAALLLAQNDLTPVRLVDTLRRLITGGRTTLLLMAQAARLARVADADEVVAQLCLEAAHA